MNHTLKLIKYLEIAFNNRIVFFQKKDNLKLLSLREGKQMYRDV